MQPLFSYKPTASKYVLPCTYPAAVSIKTTRSHSREFKEGDFQRWQTQRGRSGSSGQTRHEKAYYKRSDSKRSDSDNHIFSFSIFTRAGCRATRVKARTTERLREYGCSVNKIDVMGLFLSGYVL